MSGYSWKYEVFITIILVKPVFVAAVLHSLCHGKSMFAHFLWTIHMSIQIWSHLKFKRWRVRWRDEEKNLVQTYIMPTLVLSQIWVIKSEIKRWKKNWSKHMSSQIWCYLKFERWRVRWRDKKKLLKKKFLGPNIHQAKYGVISNCLYWQGGGGSVCEIHMYTHTHTTVTR